MTLLGSQMPRHLIGDAHELINEIPTVPTRSRVNLQPSQRSWDYLCVNSLKFYLLFFLFKCRYFMTKNNVVLERLQPDSHAVDHPGFSLVHSAVFGPASVWVVG